VVNSSDDQLASIDDIDSAPTDVPNGDNATGKKEETLLSHERDTFKRELGWLGIPFGGRSEKPGNISALVIILTFSFIALSFASETFIDVKYPDHHPSAMPFERIFSAMTSVITLILGYLFGSNDRSK
jgi:hypothetical protein